MINAYIKYLYFRSMFSNAYASGSGKLMDCCELVAGDSNVFGTHIEWLAEQNTWGLSCMLQLSHAELLQVYANPEKLNE